MAKPSGSRGNRLTAEERLLEKQREDLLRRQQQLEKKLRILPVVMEEQEQQKRDLAKRRAVAAGPAISPYMGRGTARRRGKGKSLKMPSRERFAAQMTTALLVIILAIILLLLLNVLPSSKGHEEDKGKIAAPIGHA